MRNPEVDAYVETAMLFARDREMELAIEYLGMALEITPDDPQLLYLSGSAKYMIGDDPGAIEDLNRAIELNRKNALAYIYRGAAKGALGNHWEGIKDLNIGIKLAPKSALAYYHRGEEYQYNKEGEIFGKGADLQKAISDFDWAIKLDPKNAQYWYLRGRVKVHSTGFKPDIIMADYDKAIELAPDFARGYFGRGTYKAELKDYAGAIEDLNKSIELDTEYALAYSNRGMAKKLSHDFAGALVDFDKAVELEPENGQFYFNRGSLKGCIDEIPYEDQIADLNKALELSPDEPEVYYIRGVSNRDFGFYEKAIEDFERARELRDGHANTHYYLAHCKAKVSKYSVEERLRDYDRAAELDCDKHECYIERGFLRLLTEDYTGALADAYKLIEDAPEMLEAYELAIRVNYNVGNRAGARRIVNKSLAVDPDFEFGLKAKKLLDEEDSKRSKYALWEPPPNW